MNLCLQLDGSAVVPVDGDEQNMLCSGDTVIPWFYYIVACDGMLKLCNAGVQTGTCVCMYIQSIR